MDADKLKNILERHKHWIYKDCTGWEDMKADLHRADLRGANLHEANLCGANLYEADLCGADLCGINLCEADLRRADLCRTSICEADLRGANMCEVNLRRANLYGADLRGANMCEADLRGACLCKVKIDNAVLTKIIPICCPEYGAFVGWKKARGYIVKLQITEDAKRSSAFGRKCRCSKAVVLSIENMNGGDSGLIEIASDYNDSFIYHIGKTVKVANFDDDRKNECAPGIHFFITRQEAVDYK